MATEKKLIKYTGPYKRVEVLKTRFIRDKETLVDAKKAETLLENKHFKEVNPPEEAPAETPEPVDKTTQDDSEDYGKGSKKKKK